MHVATLICDQNAGVLDEAVLDRAAALLKGSTAPVWLAPNVAADIHFEDENSNGDPRATADRIRAALGGLPIDVVVQPAEARRKRLLLADMDSTMIGQECIDELADKVGLRAHVAAITERAMRGDLAFEPALRERVALLKGLPASIIDDVLAERITLNPGARTLVQTMRAHGAYTSLVSGGFTRFTTVIAERIGFDENVGNELLVDKDSKLAGAVGEPIFGRDGKRRTLLALRARLKLRKSETLVVGDGANDLDMIVEAGLGVAYHAKPKVADAAHARIDHCDLTALLFAQGFRADELVDKTRPEENGGETPA